MADEPVAGLARAVAAGCGAGCAATGRRSRRVAAALVGVVGLAAVLAVQAAGQPRLSTARQRSEANAVLAEPTPS